MDQVVRLAVAGGLSLLFACDGAVGPPLVLGPDSGPPEVDAGTAPPPPTPWPPPPPPDRPPVAVPIVSAAEPPPPLAGGTLLVTRDGRYAVAADPDTDAIHMVSLAADALERTIALEHRDEPGRLVEDGDGRVHIALRRAGTLLTLDPESGEILARRSVCAAPRGLVWDGTTDLVHVACATGELVSFPAAGGDATRNVFVETDLRDVALAWGGLVVSRFRSAEVLVLGDDGEVLRRLSPRAVAPTPVQPNPLLPCVAWRMVAAGDSVYVLHQRAQSGVIPVTTEYYGSGTVSTVLEATITEHRLDREPTLGPRMRLPTLVTDMAVSPDGTRLGVAESATSTGPLGRSLPVREVATDGSDYSFTIFGDPVPSRGATPDSARVVAIAYAPDGTVVVQIRGVRWPGVPEEEQGLGSGLGILRDAPVFVPFGTAAEADTGFALFHASTPSGLACASCHPEAHEDGHVWSFVGDPDAVERRTQTLGGGILRTAPFHWAGDVSDLSAIMETTFTMRMRGPELRRVEVDALGQWLDALPALPGVAVSPATLTRGRALFESDAVACASCHAGDALGGSTSANVGTGGVFQVPSLRGVAHRDPWLHSGCAETLEAAIDGTCGRRDAHGHVSDLGATDLASLVAYVASL